MGLSWLLGWPIDGPPSPWAYNGMFMSSTVGKVGAKAFFGLIGGSWTLISHTLIHQGIVISADGGGALFNNKKIVDLESSWAIPWDEIGSRIGNNALTKDFHDKGSFWDLVTVEASAFELQAGYSLLIGPWSVDEIE